MLTTDSMSLLWLGYAVLSVLVLITGYLALGFLPRLPRLVISWAVAGVMWMPANYSLRLLEQGESYHGMAPAAVVAGLAFLEGEHSVFSSTLFLLIVAAAAGAGCGLLLWWVGRGRAEARRQAKLKRNAPSDSHDDENNGGSNDGGNRRDDGTATGATLSAIPEDKPVTQPSHTRQSHSKVSARQEPTLR